MAGVLEAPPEFFRELRDVCDEHGAVLIFDEVQTGIGRTGNWFFAESGHAAGTVPDIITLAKSLSSGIRVGACLVNESIASSIKDYDLGTTFGGGMIAMAAVPATLEVIETDGMIDNVRGIESFIRTELPDISKVRGVRGKGCILGIELEGTASEKFGRLLKCGIITGISSDPNVLRLLPPLCVKREHVTMLVEALKR